MPFFFLFLSLYFAFYLKIICTINNKVISLQHKRRADISNDGWRVDSNLPITERVKIFRILFENNLHN
jgi:hypothetical protein